MSTDQKGSIFSTSYTIKVLLFHSKLKRFEKTYSKYLHALVSKTVVLTWPEDELIFFTGDECSVGDKC